MRTTATRQWFVCRDGRHHGPMTQIDVAELAAGHRLWASDLIWCTGLAQWIAARDVPGLQTTEPAFDSNAKLLPPPSSGPDFDPDFGADVRPEPVPGAVSYESRTEHGTPFRAPAPRRTPLAAFAPAPRRMLLSEALQAAQSQELPRAESMMRRSLSATPPLSGRDHHDEIEFSHDDAEILAAGLEAFSDALRLQAEDSQDLAPSLLPDDPSDEMAGRAPSLADPSFDLAAQEPPQPAPDTPAAATERIAAPPPLPRSRRSDPALPPSPGPRTLRSPRA